MTLLERYNAAIASGEINDDPLQRVVLNRLQKLADDLEQATSSWFSSKPRPCSSAASWSASSRE